MAEKQLDNQATTESTWTVSSGIADPENPKAYRRETRGKANLNGGLMGVVGDMFEQFIELLSRLFGSLFNKNTDGPSLEDRKIVQDFFNDNLQKINQEYIAKGKDRAQNSFEVNKSLNMPEYANKDIASEYLLYTRFGNAKLVIADKSGANGPAIEASIKDNFLHSFSISIDQLKAFDGDPKNKIPFSGWMASPTYKKVFDDSIDKDSLLAKLSDGDKKLLKDAKFMTKEERSKFFEGHEGLEEKFVFVQRTALAVSNADLMATNMAIETGINNLTVSDMRFSPKGQIGSLQLTVQTALERAEKDYKLDDRKKEGYEILKGLRFSNTNNFSKTQVEDLVKFILKDDEYGGKNATFIDSLQKKLNDCKSQDEVALVVGGFSKIYSSEEGYLKAQQGIMGEKMAMAINAVGGIDSFNSVIYGDDVNNKGQLLVKMVNFYKFDNNEPPFTAMELYERLSGGEKAQSEQDAIYALGKLAEKDSKAIFMAGYYTTYHGTKNKETSSTALGSTNIQDKALRNADDVRFERQSTELKSLSNDLDQKKEEKNLYLETAKDMLDINAGSLRQLHLDPAFKDYNMIKGTKAKDMLATLDKAKISDKDRNNPNFQDFIKLLKDNPEAHVNGTPLEYLAQIAEVVQKEGLDSQDKNNLALIQHKVEDFRIKEAEKFFGSLDLKNLKNENLLAFMDQNGSRRMLFEKELDKYPEIKEVLKKYEESGTQISFDAMSNWKTFRESCIFAKTFQKGEININSVAYDQAIQKFSDDENKAVDKNFGTKDEITSDRRQLEKGRGSTQGRLYTRVETMVAEAHAFKEMYLNDKSPDHKELIKNHNDLYHLINIVSFGPERVETLGYRYQDLKNLLVNEMVKNNMFFGKESMAKDFVEALVKERSNVLDRAYPTSMGDSVEKILENLYRDKAISPALASFLVEKNLLTEDNFSKINPFDGMHEVSVTTTKGELVRLTDYNKYAKEDFVQIYEKGWVAPEDKISVASKIKEEGLDIPKIEKETLASKDAPKVSSADISR